MRSTRTTPALLSEPRKVGGVYFNGYWQQAYRVREIETQAGRLVRITVEWEDGRETTHCTMWDHKRDRVLRDPPSLGA